MMLRALQATALVAVAGLFALLVWRLTHESHPPKLGGPAPVFSLKRLDSESRLDLMSLRGKPVVINFFASWCEPCKAESKVLETAWQQYKGRVVFVGIDYNDLRSDGLRFVHAHDITFPVVSAGSGAVGDAYGLTGVPETYFVDAHGRLVGSHIVGTVAHQKSAFYDGIKAALHS
jgi:cytochrome c biogenesis protein CcmG, thiol:disulfide interchange protein DsbE